MKFSKLSRSAWLLGTVAAIALTACSSGDAKLLKEADAAVSSGDYVLAADLYAQISDKSSRDGIKASLGIKNLVSVSNLKAASTEDIADILEDYNSFDFESSTDKMQKVYNFAVERISTEDTDEVSSLDLLDEAQDLNVETPQDLSAKRLELAQAINKENPSNVRAASIVGEFHYNQGDIESAKAALLPVRAELGDSEGARVLGQVFIAEGNNKDAYPLLSTYTSSRLKTFQEAEKKFGDLQTALWDSEFDNLNEGRGPKSFYDKYDLTPEDEQQLFVDEYISEAVNNNASYQNALNNYREAASIVPVVMDFGILQLRNAETMSSESERKAELKAAEETFLSIRSVAGDSDDFKIYLGQVYFWLGKQDDGQALFDEVIERSGRDPGILMTVASTLRTLGKVGMAAELTQEAYENSKDDETKYFAASMMQHLSNTIEDKIKWLERSDTNAAYVKANLMENKGHLAVQKGNNKQAASFYRQAIEHSESLPESASNFNNTALTYFALHQVTGDQEFYGKGVDLMSKAVELAPDQSILLSNSASTRITNSLYEVLGNKIDFSQLKLQPSLEHASYYYSNEEEKSELRKKLAAHPDMIKAVEYFERSILLSPNSLSNYGQLQQVHYFLKNEDAMVALAAKMAENQVDVSSSNQFYLDFVKGENKETELEKLKDREQILRKQLTGKNINASTRGVIHAQISKTLTSQVYYGVPGVAEKALTHAEKSFELIPSSSSENTLTTALLTVASLQTAAKIPAYQQIREQTNKSLSDNILATIMLSKPGEIGDSLRSNRLVERAVAMEVRGIDDFPDSSSTSSWVLLQQTEDSGLAKKMAKRIQSSKMDKALTEISRISSPISASIIVEDYLLGKVNGTNGVSQEKLDKLTELGIQLPAGLFE